MYCTSVFVQLINLVGLCEMTNLVLCFCQLQVLSDMSSILMSVTAHHIILAFSVSGGIAAPASTLLIPVLHHYSLVYCKRLHKYNLWKAQYFDLQDCIVHYSCTALQN